MSSILEVFIHVHEFPKISFSVVTIFAGVELAKARAPFYLTYILITYVCYLLVIFFILEVHSFISKRAGEICIFFCLLVMKLEGKRR